MQGTVWSAAVGFLKRYTIHIVAFLAVIIGFLVPFLTTQNDEPTSTSDHGQAHMGGTPPNLQEDKTAQPVGGFVTVKTFNVRVNDAQMTPQVLSDFGIDPRSAYASELERACGGTDIRTQVSKAFEGKRFVVRRTDDPSTADRALEDGVRQGMKDGIAKLNPRFAFAPRLVSEARISHRAAQGQGGKHYIADVFLPCGFEVSFEANLIDLP